MFLQSRLQLFWEIWQAKILFLWSVKRYVSIITFISFSPLRFYYCLNIFFATSYQTWERQYWYHIDFISPIFKSHFCFKCLYSGVAAPKGKPITVQTFTSDPLSSSGCKFYPSRINADTCKIILLWLLQLFFQFALFPALKEYGQCICLNFIFSP